MLPVLRGYFEQYGVVVVFVSAFLEGLLLVGVYYPGSLAIFLGVILAVGHPWQAVAVVAATSVGLWLAYTANYFLGRHGWYKVLAKFGLADEIERTRMRLDRYFAATFFFGYFGPNFAALVSTAAGVLRVPLVKFLTYSTIYLLAWNVFWGLLVYNLGDAALEIVGFKTFFIIIGAWVVVQIILYIYERRTV